MNQRSLEVQELLPPKGLAATTSGGAVNLAGYINPGGREMKAFASCGSSSGTPTCDIKIQQSSATNTGWADITGATFVQITNTAVPQEIHFQASQQYIRAVATIGGGTPNVTVGCWVLAEARYTP